MLKQERDKAILNRKNNDMGALMLRVASQAIVQSNTLSESEGNNEVKESLETDWDEVDDDDYLEDDTTSITYEQESYQWAKEFIWSDGERVVHCFKVYLVMLQTMVEGELLLTNHCIYFRKMGDEIDVMTQEPIPEEGEDKTEFEERRWRLNRLIEVHIRRYMLRSQALELFFADTHELFVNFSNGRKDRDLFFTKLRYYCKVPMLSPPKSLNPSSTFSKSNVTELWQKRKISNFEYLMQLNLYSGRSYNDITQYPIFPWCVQSK